LRYNQGKTSSTLAARFKYGGNSRELNLIPWYQMSITLAGRVN